MDTYILECEHTHTQDNHNTRIDMYVFIGLFCKRDLQFFLQHANCWKHQTHTHTHTCVKIDIPSFTYTRTHRTITAHELLETTGKKMRRDGFMLASQHFRTSFVLQCVAVCCSVLQCVAACCSVLQRVAVCCRVLSVLHCVAVCYSVLQCVTVCCIASQCVAVRCSMWQCVAVYGSVL